MSKLKLTITHFKLLDTIKWLNDQGYYASNQGVYKITHGVYDKDTINFTGCPTFSTLVSYGSNRREIFLLP